MGLPGPILLGEDSEEDAILFTWFLRRCGEAAEIKVMSDGNDIAAYIKREGPYALDQGFQTPKIIFLDGHFRRESTLGLVQLIREHPATKDVPIFVLTGSLDSKVCEEALRLGAADCFEKPFNTSHLARVQALLEQKHPNGGKKP